MRRSFWALACLFLGCFSPASVAALSGTSSAVASGGTKKPLVISEDDVGNLSSEFLFLATRTWNIDERWSLQTLASFEVERERADRDFNETNAVTFGGVLRYTFDCCGTVSSGLRYTREVQVNNGSENWGLKFGADHVVFKKVAGEWTSPRIFFGWSNIRFPGALGGDHKDWVAQGRYEISQGFEARPFSAMPVLYTGLGFTVDREGLSYNNKLVADAGLRFSWKVKKTSITLDFRGIRDRRFVSDELFLGHQIRLGFRHVF